MGIWQDIQFAARLLVKDKWFTLVATIALALGIGVNATVFTFVNAVLIRGLPVDDPERVLALRTRDVVRSRNGGVSYLDLQDWTTMSRSFVGFAAYSGTTMNVSDEGRTPERFAGNYISAGAFRLLGEAPILGRDFQASDDQPGAAPVVLLGNGVWKNRYGSDPSVVGRTVRINDVPAVVIGVMPEGFKFPQNADLWMPFSNVNNLQSQQRNTRNFGAFTRLRPDVPREQAAAELRNIGQNLAKEYPDTNKDIQPELLTFNEQQNGGPLRSVFLSLMGAVGFVLLIACANVANLLLARSTNRAREISVRISLGATRKRVIRQLLIESVMLAAVAGILGLALANVGIRLFDVATGDVRPYWIHFTFDGRVVAFFAAVCLGTGIIFGLAPALHTAKTDVNEVLKEGGRSGSAGTRVRRWSSVLIVGELALTLALLAGAAFMVQNFLASYRMDVGIETAHLLTTSLQLPDRKYPSIEQRLAFYERLEERLRANPQFASVSVASNIPMFGAFARQLRIEGKEQRDGEQVPNVSMVTVDPHYFQTLGVTLARGRGFTAQDGAAGQENAIINQRFAQMHFANEDPIGRRITLSIDLQGGPPPGQGIPLQLTVTIVGIAPNVRQGPQAEPAPIAYLPYRIDPRGTMNLIARTSGDPLAMAPALREEVRAVDADLPLFNIRSLDQQLEQQRWPFKVFGTMFGVFAFIALMLSAVGLYAVTAYQVAQRTSEIGVRMALGAQSPQVLKLFLRRGLIQLTIGLVLGVAAAFGVGAIFQAGGILVQVSPRDPWTIGSIATILAVVGLAACVWPARRATRLDPVLALRRD